MSAKQSDEWADAETIADESPSVIVFDQVGDVFIGRYAGKEIITPEDGETEPFRQDRFRVVTPLGDLHEGDWAAIRPGFQLRDAFDKLQPGDVVRIEYLKDIPTGRKLNPLKDFKVQVRRA